MQGIPAALDPRALLKFETARRRASGLKLAKYVLAPFGLAPDTVGDVTVDGTIALVQPHPHADICLCPLTGNPQPTESVAWYYADCIAYEHDIPVIVLPQRGDFERFGYRYAHSGRTKPEQVEVVDVDSGGTSTRTLPRLSAKRAVKEYYWQSLCSILENVREIRQGPLTFVYFRHESRDRTLDLPYTAKYSAVAQEIHLYSVALRQADSLGEFLCYYRVIESATHSNGKAWIASSLHALTAHDFGRIAIAHEWGRRPRNLLSIWRSRALRRLSVLRQSFGSPTEIARYLYETNRCGIAHGKTIVRADIMPSYFEVVRDTYLLKLLARLAIDQKL
jgi:hypothetical protein